MKVKDFGDDIKIAYCCIYVFRNKLNGKCYVGQSVEPEKRYNAHINAAKHGSKYHFHRALRKYGIENFDYFLVYGNHLPIENIRNILNEQERKWVKFFDSYNNGYNMTPGGDGSGKSGTKGMLGKNHNDETKEKIRQHSLLQMQDPEQIRKIRESLTGRKQNPNTVAKRAKSLKGKNKGKHRVYREDGTFYMAK